MRELSGDVPPLTAEADDSVPPGLTSDEDAGSVTVNRREIVVVINVVVVEVVGGPLLV